MEAIGVTLLQDLAVVCIASGIFALIFHCLKLPLLLGYMVGGFVIGPHFFSTWIHGEQSIVQLSELGVIFLMFYIGLEFDLMKLRKIFVPSAFWLTLQTVGMMIIGMLIAPLLGWSGLNGIFLGSMLIMSSTMITIPLLKAKNALNTEYAQCAVGCLILEDILAIVFLVVLSSIAKTGQLDLLEMQKSAFVIGVFVVMVFCLGKLLAPFFVRVLFRSSSAEVLVVTVIGMTMAIALLAEHFNFSVALGAFLAGSILSQTNIAEQVEKITEPLRNVFNAVFFTTIGMRIDLKAIMHLWPWIIALALLTFIGQTVIGTIALFLVGKRSETAFKAAFSKAQIGEFSFIIAGLGDSLHVLHKDFMSVTVGIALGTILICSVLSSKVDAIFQFLHSKCTNSMMEFGKAYHNILGEIKDNISKNTFIKLTMRQLLLATLWFFLLSGTLFTVSWLATLTKSGEFGVVVAKVLKFFSKIFYYVDPSYVAQWQTKKVSEISSNVFQLCIWAAAFLLCTPFLVGIVKSIQAIFVALIKNSFSRKTQDELLNNRVFGVMKAVFVIAALFLFSGIFLGIASRYLPHGVPVALFVIVVIFSTILLWKQLSKINNRMELAFIESFNSKIESQEQINRKAVLAKAADSDPWPIAIHEIAIRANHDVVGKRIADLQLRKLTGTTVIAIARGGVSTYALSPESQIFPGDHVIVMGMPSQIENAKAILLKDAEGPQPKRDYSQFDILSFCIGGDENFAGKILSSLSLRQKFGINVVGIQRKNDKIIDIKPDMELRANDILLLVGTKSAIGVFRKEFSIDDVVKLAGE
ncbi:MAG: cation:proton antiporter [Puniceicoccales bacterium]|jgi:CPA2 family monovalent cation:H+ antiporter-2|nr:cation:proton antiporter [Puniceicoccales bacterium]